MPAGLWQVELPFADLIEQIDWTTGWCVCEYKGLGITYKLRKTTMPLSSFTLRLSPRGLCMLASARAHIMPAVPLELW